MRNLASLAFTVLVLTLTACASSPRDRSDMTAVTPVSITELDGDLGGADYRIGVSDLLRVSVFQVPDLSFDELRVDSSGNIHMPLIGAVRAEGRTAAELARVMTDELGSQFLRNPQVVITVTEAANQKVTVDGAVTKPGVYTMRGRTTLMQAVAMAEGPSRTADLRSLAVFRRTEQGRMVAVFDLTAIRNGTAEDPVILGDDIIIVDTSRLNKAMLDVLQALPGLAVFAYF